MINEMMIENFRERWERKGDIPIWKVFLLAEMARKDIYPDSTFSDAECCVWEAFRHSN